MECQLSTSNVADRIREYLWAASQGRKLNRLRRVVRTADTTPAGLASFPVLLDLDFDEHLAQYLAGAATAATGSLGMMPFENQHLAAAAMLRGHSIELATGEGKTLVGALVAAGYALAGHRVHVLTANDYLAERDAQWMRPFYESFGLSCGMVVASSSREQRQQAYGYPITYASVSEAGFDLLRDRLSLEKSSRTGAQRDVVILDEADAVLLDEARVPLVLAADAAAHADENATMLATFVGTMDPEFHYAVAADRRTVNLTDKGLQMVEEAFPTRDLFGADADFLVSLNLALYAHAVLERDIDYVVDDGRVWLVSGSRGRVERLQRWPDGLQLAVEAKEQLGSETGLEVLDQLVVAELIGAYIRVVGMSATMTQAADELSQLYGIDVVAIPPHTPCTRMDHPTQLYQSTNDRDRALTSLIADVHRSGRPILVACQSVRDSERCATHIKEAGLECVLLNAKNDREEASIIAEAGAARRITVSTQMAGRGTDIILSPEATQVGGLYVIGVGRFPSNRLDDQLRGRAGRQGDPGDSVFLASLDDRLLLDSDATCPPPNSVTETGLIEDCKENRKALRAVDHAQRVSDGEQRSLRWLSWRYGEVLRIQRSTVLELREICVAGDGLVELLAAHDGEALATLRERVGTAELSSAAPLVLLSALDMRWSIHLAHASEVREGIHLRVLVREDPLTEFEREMAKAYRGLVDAALNDAMNILKTAPIHDGHLDLTEITERIPTATWAYTVTDNSLGTELERLSRGFWRR